MTENLFMIWVGNISSILKIYISSIKIQFYEKGNRHNKFDEWVLISFFGYRHMPIMEKWPEKGPEKANEPIKFGVLVGNVETIMNRKGFILYNKLWWLYNYDYINNVWYTSYMKQKVVIWMWVFWFFWFLVPLVLFIVVEKQLKLKGGGKKPSEERISN